MAILCANDISISIGQWLDYTEHYYGYYFIALLCLLVATAKQCVNSRYMQILKRVKFESFEVPTKFIPGSPHDRQHHAQPIYCDGAE